MTRHWELRSVALGMLVGGGAVLAHILTQFGQPRVSELLVVVVLSPLVAGISAGVAVGLTTSDTRGAFLSGGMAGTLGTVFGLVAYATLEAVTVSGWTIAQRLDIYFVIASYTGLPLMAVGPVIFFGGGYAGSLVARQRQSVEEPDLSDLSRRNQ